jgi:hypothetical protein
MQRRVTRSPVVSAISVSDVERPKIRATGERNVVEDKADVNNVRLLSCGGI